MESINERTRDRVADDFAGVLRDAENLLKKAGQETGEKAQQLRAEAESKLLVAKYRLQELEQELVARGRVAAKRADDYVHESPWTSIGVAAVVGFVAGLLLNRR